MSAFDDEHWKQWNIRHTPKRPWDNDESETVVITSVQEEMKELEAEKPEKFSERPATKSTTTKNR